MKISKSEGVRDVQALCNNSQQNSVLEKTLDDIKEKDYRSVGIDLTENLDGGVLKTIVKEGQGFDRPEEGAQLTVNLTGKILENDSIFDNRQALECRFGDGSLCEGLEIALLSMTEKEISKITIQSPYLVIHNDQTLEVKKDLNDTSNMENQDKMIEDPNKAVLKNTFEDLCSKGYVVQYSIELIRFTSISSINLSNEERVSEALRFKDLGNRIYADASLGNDLPLKAQKYRRAIRKYHKAIQFLSGTFYNDKQLDAESNKHKLLILLNLAQCKLCLKSWKEAKEYSDKAIRLDPKNIKAYFRRGRANVGLREYSFAEKDFKKVIELDPYNGDVAPQLDWMHKKREKQLHQEKVLYRRMLREMGQQEAPLPLMELIKHFGRTLLKPGVTKENLQLLNYVFLAWFIIILLIMLLGTGTMNIHFFIFILLAGLLFATLRWFIGVWSEQKKLMEIKEETDLLMKLQKKKSS